MANPFMVRCGSRCDVYEICGLRLNFVFRRIARVVPFPEVSGTLPLETFRAEYVPEAKAAASCWNLAQSGEPRWSVRLSSD